MNTQLSGPGSISVLHCTGLTGGRKLGSICHLSCGGSSTATGHKSRCPIFGLWHSHKGCMVLGIGSLIY